MIGKNNYKYFMIQDYGKNWIRLDSRNALINHYWDLLKEIDLFIQANNDLEDATYWSICRDNFVHNEIFCYNNTGKKITTPWVSIVKQFPELPMLQNKLYLHAYIGRTMAGNWGIHRHCYAPNSSWNLAVFDAGCSNGQIEFYKSQSTKLNPSSEYYEDEVEFNSVGFKLVDSVPLMTGDIISLNTWEWHAHITVNKNVCAFLSCLKNTPCEVKTRTNLKKIFKSI